MVFQADRGETVIDNLCLLCRYHHTQVHLELLTLEDIAVRPTAPAERQRKT